MQLPLPFSETPATAAPAAPQRGAAGAPAAVKVLDRLSTREVLRIVGVNRSTIFRWTRKGIFPARHRCGGWLRADVEGWLTARRDETRGARH